MPEHPIPGLTTDSATGLPVLAEGVTKGDGWLWVERIPQIMQGKRVEVQVIFLPHWEEEE